VSGKPVDRVALRVEGRVGELEPTASLELVPFQ